MSGSSPTKESEQAVPVAKSAKSVSFNSTSQKGIGDSDSSSEETISPGVAMAGVFGRGHLGENLHEW